MNRFIKRTKVFLERGFENIIYINIRIDLCMLEFFGRKYTYLIFIFAFFVGNFDSSENLSDGFVLFRFFCFCLSWYLISTSIFIFILFNIKNIYIKSWAKNMYSPKLEIPVRKVF